MLIELKAKRLDTTDRQTREQTNICSKMNLPGVAQFFCQKLLVSERKETQHQRMPASTWWPDKKKRTLQNNIEQVRHNNKT